MLCSTAAMDTRSGATCMFFVFCSPNKSALYCTSSPGQTGKRNPKQTLGQEPPRLPSLGLSMKWDSRLDRPCVCVCVCMCLRVCVNVSIPFLLARFNRPMLLPPMQTMRSVCMCVCVCVCVTPIHFIQSNSVCYDTSPLYSRVCVCLCVCVCAGGRTILKREARMGPWPPAVASGASFKKTKHTALANCGAVSGACSGRGRGPHLSQNLWGLAVMSPLSLLYHARRRPAVDSTSSWQGGGGVVSALPRLWGRIRSGPGGQCPLSPAPLR